MKWPWVVMTDRSREGPRKGYGGAQLTRTLCHLADRGDEKCLLAAEHGDGDVPALVTVDLAKYRRSTS